MRLQDSDGNYSDGAPPSHLEGALQLSLRKSVRTSRRTKRAKLAFPTKGPAAHDLLEPDGEDREDDETNTSIEHDFRKRSTVRRKAAEQEVIGRLGRRPIPPSESQQANAAFATKPKANEGRCNDDVEAAQESQPVLTAAEQARFEYEEGIMNNIFKPAGSPDSWTARARPLATPRARVNEERTRERHKQVAAGVRGFGPPDYQDRMYRGMSRLLDEDDALEAALRAEIAALEAEARGSAETIEAKTAALNQAEERISELEETVSQERDDHYADLEKVRTRLTQLFNDLNEALATNGKANRYIRELTNAPGKRKRTAMAPVSQIGIEQDTRSDMPNDSAQKMQDAAENVELSIVVARLEQKAAEDGRKILELDWTVNKLRSEGDVELESERSRNKELEHHLETYQAKSYAKCEELETVIGSLQCDQYTGIGSAFLDLLKDRDDRIVKLEGELDLAHERNALQAAQYDAMVIEKHSEIEDLEAEINAHGNVDHELTEEEGGRAGEEESDSDKIESDSGSNEDDSGGLEGCRSE